MGYDHILIATDNSPPAQQATAEAVLLANSCDATLHALYVLKPGEPPPWSDDPALEPGIDTQAGQAMDSVAAEAADQDFHDDIITSIMEVPTVPVILSYAEEKGIELVVLGTHGRPGIERILLGSVAEQTVRESPGPVLTVRANER